MKNKRVNMRKLFILCLMVLGTISSMAQTTPTKSQVNSELTTEKVDVTLSMEETLSAIVTKAMQVAEATGEFVMEQAPLLLQEFYAYRLILEWTWTISVGVFTFGLLALLIFGWVGAVKNRDLDDAALPLTLLSFLWMVPFLIWVECFLDLLMLYVAPKLYLIDYFTSSC
jgi:hypothetical protein